MEVTLMGPDDLGCWFLTDDEGNALPFVTRHEDHPCAAAMLGWEQPEGIEDEEAVILDALNWLNEHTGEEFAAPLHVVEYFAHLDSDLVTLKLRTDTPLCHEEIDLLVQWGGKLLFDSGIMVVVQIPAGRVKAIATWDKVLEILH